MICADKERLFTESFEALEEQHRVLRQFAVVASFGNHEIATIAKRQSEVAIEESYDAWLALNEHQHSHRCAA